MAWRISELVAVFPGVLLVSVFPVLSRYVADRDPRLRPGLQVAFDAFCLLGIGIATGGAIVAGRLAEAIGGDAFAGSAAPLRILLCAAALGCVGGLLGNALIARGMQVRALWLNLAALAVNVALNVALVPSQGILAAAWIALGCELGLLAGSIWLVRRAFGFAPSPAALGRIVPAAAVMAAVLWPLRTQPVVLTVPLGAVVLLGAARALGALDPARLRSLARP
jgi:O-antigen/teichoic acid export membrane protein